MTSTATVARELVLLTRTPTDELASWLRAVQARASTLDPGRATFLLVSPLGWSAREQLLERLAAGRVQVVSRTVIPAWPRVDSAIRHPAISPSRLRRAARFEAVWESLYPATPGEAWGLAPGAHARAVALKASLRRELPGLAVDLGGGWTGQNVLHAFHLADPQEAREEARRLLAALELDAERRVRRGLSTDPASHSSAAPPPPKRQGTWSRQ
jgi:hypothetical protein